MGINVNWDATDVMRAFPQLNYAEAQSVLDRMSKFWKPREIGLLRELCIRAGAHSGEPGDYAGLDQKPR